ncbi:MAG: transcriptional repressor [Polyangiaceae bacterium]
MHTETQIAERLAEFERACQRAGVKVTHQRLEVLREVIQSGEHPSAEAILEGVKVRLPTVLLDTVYRTLWLLTDSGIDYDTWATSRRGEVRRESQSTPSLLVCALWGRHRCGNVGLVTTRYRRTSQGARLGRFGPARSSRNLFQMRRIAA